MWAHGGVPLIVLKGCMWETLRVSRVQDMTWQCNEFEGPSKNGIPCGRSLGERRKFSWPYICNENSDLMNLLHLTIDSMTDLVSSPGKPIEFVTFVTCILFCSLIKVLVTHTKKKIKIADSRPGKWTTKSIANNLCVSIKWANVGLGLDQSNPARGSLVWCRVKFGWCFSMVALLTTSDFILFFFCFLLLKTESKP